MVRIESDVVTVSGTTVWNHYAIPPPPALTNVPIRLDVNALVKGDEFKVHYTKAMDDLVKGMSSALSGGIVPTAFSWRGAKNALQY